MAVLPATPVRAQAARLVNITIDDEHSEIQTGHLVTYRQHWYSRQFPRDLTALDAGSSRFTPSVRRWAGTRSAPHSILTICASAGGAALLIAAAVWYLLRLRRRRRRSAVATAPDSPIAFTPYPVPPAPRAREPPGAAPEILFEKPRPVAQAQAPATSPEAPQASAAVERLQAELERVLEENEMLRQAAEPPPGYSDGARSVSGHA